MENNTQLLKGILEFCVLKLISREPTYGYEIVMNLKQVGFSDLSESTLYPLLLRLEQQGKVTVEQLCYTDSVIWSVTMTVRFHLFPFRTQKLSSLVPKIVRWKRRVKRGSRRLDVNPLRK